MPLSMTKVAVGCASLTALEKRQRERILRHAAHDDAVPVYTRVMPKRADEMVGGSVFWIVRHVLVARQRILGFEEGAWGGRKGTIVLVDPALTTVLATPKRAHQGWRYLEEPHAPPDLGEEHGELGELPPVLMAKLRGLALI